MGLLTTLSPKTISEKSAPFPHPGNGGSKEEGIAAQKKSAAPVYDLGPAYLTEASGSPEPHSQVFLDPFSTTAPLHKKFNLLPPAQPCPICQGMLFWIATYDVRGSKPICDLCKSSKIPRQRRMVAKRLMAATVTGDGGAGGEGEQVGREGSGQEQEQEGQEGQEEQFVWIDFDVWMAWVNQER